MLRGTWNEGIVLNKAATTSKGVIPALASLCAAVLLTACGGGSPLEDEVTLPKKAASVQEATANKRFSTTYSSGDFNPGVWEDHRWYECDCGRDSAPMESTPWKPAN